MIKWKAIPGYSGYEVSTEGQLKTFNWKNSGRQAILKPALTGGYLKTMLKRDDGKTHSITVHRMVAKAFLENPENKPCINHKNGIKTDNRVENIEWCTIAENAQHAFKTGLNHGLRGSENGNSKLTDADVVEIRKVAASGGRYYGRKELALRFGVSEAYIKELVSRRRNVWAHI